MRNASMLELQPLEKPALEDAHQRDLPPKLPIVRFFTQLVGL